MKLPALRPVMARGLTAIRRQPLLVPRGRARLASLVLGSVVLAGATTQVGIAWSTALPDNAVFRAGDTVVTEDEFQQRIDVLEALYVLKPPKQGPQLDQFHKAAAKSVAVSLVLDRAAQERGIVIADKQARDALNKIIEEQLRGGRQDFVRFLGSRGIAERDVLDEFQQQLATSKLFEQVTGDIQPVTDKEVRQAYKDRKKDMVTPEKRHLRNIVVDSRSKAKRLLQQARGGADFATLAKQHSLDESTKNSGGDLGNLTADQLGKQYARAAFEAGENAIFGPVKNQHGWNIGQVLQVTPAKPLSFAEVKKQLEAELNNKRKLDSWRTWLGNQITAADVEYADKYRPDNPDAPPTSAPPR